MNDFKVSVLKTKKKLKMKKTSLQEFKDWFPLGRAFRDSSPSRIPTGTRALFLSKRYFTARIAVRWRLFPKWFVQQLSNSSRRSQKGEARGWCDDSTTSKVILKKSLSSPALGSFYGTKSEILDVRWRLCTKWFVQNSSHRTKRGKPGDDVMIVLHPKSL